MTSFSLYWSNLVSISQKRMRDKGKVKLTSLRRIWNNLAPNLRDKIAASWKVVTLSNEVSLEEKN